MPSWPLQQALFAALSADAALTALIGAGRVHDDVPQGTSLPYIILGPSTAQDWSTGGEDGTEHSFAVHVWTDARGKRQAYAILAAVRAALHEKPLALAGHALVNLRHQRSEVGRSRAGEAIHAIASFRAVTAPE